MPAGSKKGERRGGRPKGAGNKAIAPLRECIQRIADSTIADVEAWIRAGAHENPLAAAKLVLDMLEYVTPKLNRTELTGKDGEAIVLRISKTDSGL